jgi:hypothetical protein
MTTPDVAALLAENARLRAIVDRVEALASGASQHWSSAPADGTLAVVTTSGGWQDIPATERVYVRSDAYDEELAARGLAPREDGEWWKVGDEKPYPYSWGELNWLDDPACDRGTVSIETFVSVEALDAALNVEPAVAS